MENERILEREPNSKVQTDWDVEAQNTNHEVTSRQESCTETAAFVANNDDPPPYESVVSNGLPWSRIFSTNVQCCDSINQFEPLTLYSILKLNTSRLIRAPSTSLNSEDSAKVNAVTAKKYGVIFIGCVVVVSLMALSLLVRCVVEKSFWQS